ncbi:MAG: hypothetical protein JNK87_31415 [Bryobacterales bacterium]|nr:hypothetical protein [Bryobacterales bacterium]
MSAKPGPKLQPETLRRLHRLFPQEYRQEAEQLLFNRCGRVNIDSAVSAADVERIRTAALKVSNGKIGALLQAIQLAQVDYRDLLRSAGFSQDAEAHLTWEP